MNKYILIILLSLFAISCSQNTSNKYEIAENEYLNVPSHFPAPNFPQSNPYTKEKAELGRYLFYEPLLVKDTSFPSCSHCMYQDAAFSNNVQLARGYKNFAEPRNNMTLVNSAYRDIYFWDGRGKSIEATAYRSMTLQYIFASDTNEIVKRLENSLIYPKLFQKAYGANTKISAYLISQALATFVRTLISGNSKYDKYINGDINAMNEEEIAGMKLFNSEKTRCSVCHSGIFFSDMKPHNTGVVTHYFDKGHFWVTGKREHRGTFITPTLRNIAQTAPYMHLGDLKTLDEVLHHYNNGGSNYQMKDTLIRPLHLTNKEIKSLKAFLLSLTDEEFLNNKKFSNPHKQDYFSDKIKNNRINRK